MAVEVILAPAIPLVNPDQGGDCTYESGLPINWTTGLLQFGNDTAKTPVKWGSVAHWDPRSIPLGALTVIEAKLESMPTITDSSAFSADFEVLSLDPRLDVVDVGFLDAQFIFEPQWQIFPARSAWVDSRQSGSDVLVSRYMSVRDGLGDFSQAWIANHTGDLTAHYWFLERSGVTNGATVRCDLYTADGSSGSWKAGTLMDTGLSFDADAKINDSSPTIVGYSTSGGPGGPFPQIVSGTTYVSKYVITGGSGANWIGAHALSTAPNGGIDNIAVYGHDGSAPVSGAARQLQGFQDRIRWMTGSRIRLASAVGGERDIVPAFTSGALQRWASVGHSYTGVTLVLSELAPDLQTVLRARTSSDQLIGFRVQDFVGTTANRFRQFQGQRHGSPTTGSLFGMVLTIKYEPVAITSRGVRTSPRLLGKMQGRARLASGLQTSSRASARLSASRRVLADVRGRARVTSKLRAAGQAAPALTCGGLRTVPRITGEIRSGSRLTSEIDSTTRLAASMDSGSRVGADVVTRPRVVSKLTTGE